MTFDQVLDLASSPALPAPTDFTFVLGQRSSGLDHLDYLDDPDLYEALCGMDNPAFFRPATEGHLVLTGDVGAGKTVLIRDLARQAVETMKVYLYDSWHALQYAYTEAPPEVAGLAGFSFTLRGAADMLRAVRDEVRRRERLEAADREVLPRILVLLDDSSHLALAEDASHLFGGTTDTREMAQASASCLALLAEIATARDANVTLVFASAKDPAEAGVPAELIEAGFTHVSFKRSYQHESADSIPPADRHRPAVLTRPGFEPERMDLDYRPDHG